MLVKQSNLLNVAFKEEELELGEELGGEIIVLDVEAEKCCVYLVWTGLSFSLTPLFFHSMNVL